MTGASVLYTLLGAALVMAGVLITALADRIRGLRAVREKTAPRAAIEVIEQPKVKHTSAPREQEAVVARARGTAGASPVQAKMEATAKEVITALTEAGFKKAVASEAVWSCNAVERQTVEIWTGAALRRMAGGAV